MRTMRRRLNSIDMRSLDTSCCWRSGSGKRIGPAWRQAMGASARSSASPSGPLMPPGAFEAGGARTGDVAGHALHARVVIGFDDDVVVAADPLERRVHGADLLARCGLPGRCGQ